jgi:hypothetical protein
LPGGEYLQERGKQGVLVLIGVDISLPEELQAPQDSVGADS